MARIKLSVVLILVCAIKCLAMSHNELEDFENYLKKTSQLSPTLKKGAEHDEDFDEDEPASDHAWEESGKFEGDLVLNERQRRLIVENVAEGLSRNGIRDGTKRWPNNEVIYFIQREHFNSDQVQAIESGIDDLARASCITFRPYNKGDRDAVVIQGSRRGCFSQVGYQGGYQVLNLSGRHPAGRGCFRHGTVVHELLHTLGFYHMQSSPDRDDYVDVVWENIIEPARHNFRKYNLFAVSDFGVGYDYDSVLHYSRRAFSVNGQDTIVPKKRGAEIGQRIALSDKDAEKLNKMYCDANSNEGASQQADGGATEKDEVTKKTTKNKPFDGHGIGYHQGKAVVIKLLPAPETYKLPDVPSFHVFDYFSKTPETLPTPENQGNHMGKEIAYSFNPPEPSITEIQTKPIVIPIHHTNSETRVNSSENQSTPQITAHDETYDNFDEAKHPFVEEFNTENEEHISSSTDKPLDISENLDHDLIDAFDRLSKIIKHHIYPSQTPNLDIYKGSVDHKSIASDNQKELYETSPPSKENMKAHKENVQTAVQYIENFYEVNPDNLIVKDNHQQSAEKTDNYENEAKENTASKATEEPSYGTSDFEAIGPHYRSFPIYKQLANDYYSERIDYEPSPEHHRSKDNYENAYDSKATDYGELKEEFGDKRTNNKVKWFVGDVPQYHPISHDHDSDLGKSLHGKSNGSERDEWNKPYYKRNKENYRYSSVHGKKPDYETYSAPVQLYDNWFGTGKLDDTLHERDR